MRIDFYGHACVGVQGSKKILIDPYLSGNPAASLTPEQAEADYLLITHGHGDHLGDAVEIAKRTGAQVVAMVELANWLGKQGVEALGMNLGGSYTFADGFKVKLVPAWHSSHLRTERRWACQWASSSGWTGFASTTPATPPSSAICGRLSRRTAWIGLFCRLAIFTPWGRRTL